MRSRPIPALSAIVISMMLYVIMQIRFYGRDYDTTLNFENEIKLRDALVESKILPSTVVVSFEEQILPLSTVIKNDIELLVTTVSSGG